MIIPKIKDKIKKGDSVITLSPIDLPYCHITIGHEFIVLKHNILKGVLTLKDVDSDFTINIRDCEKLTKKTDLKTANHLHIETVNKGKFYKFIGNHCPNMTTRYEDRDEYTACKLKSRYHDSCCIKDSCIQYIDNKIIKRDDFIVTYMRYLKIKKLKSKKKLVG